MRVLHGTTLVWGLAGTLVALAMIQVQSALDAWWNLQGIFAGGMLGLFLLGLMAKGVSSKPAMIAGLLGVAFIGWLSLSGQTFFHKNLTIVLGTSAVVVIGVLLGALFKPRS
jgi:SSS family solute:Na+ symporter